eukprot:6183969-Pleurochrysis_carterae.AAC.1
MAFAGLPQAHLVLEDNVEAGGGTRYVRKLEQLQGRARSRLLKTATRRGAKHTPNKQHLEGSGDLLRLPARGLREVRPRSPPATLRQKRRRRTVLVRLTSRCCQCCDFEEVRKTTRLENGNGAQPSHVYLAALFPKDSLHISFHPFHWSFHPCMIASTVSL